VLAERLRACVADEPVDTRSGPLNVTVSIGLSVTGPGRDDVTTLLAAADRGLYQAKQAGRNRVGDETLIETLQ
jgi:diguanylate cyclase (GGDEF)-like protein